MTRPTRRIKVTVEAELVTGTYEVTYNNVTHPGESMDFMEIMDLMRKVFNDQERQVNDDADTGETGQASRTKEDLQ